jgi:hypothetical protein
MSTKRDARRAGMGLFYHRRPIRRDVRLRRLAPVPRVNAFVKFAAG